MKKLYKDLTNTLNTGLLNNIEENFDRRYQLKSKTTAMNESKFLENLSLKATGLLIYQFQRRFYLRLCGSRRQDTSKIVCRKGALMRAPAYFMKTTALVRCIAANISASDIELRLLLAGFFTYNNDQKFCIAIKSLHSGQKLFFDNPQQTPRPSPDIFTRRGT